MAFALSFTHEVVVPILGRWYIDANGDRASAKVLIPIANDGRRPVLDLGRLADELLALCHRHALLQLLKGVEVRMLAREGLAVESV